MPTVECRHRRTVRATRVTACIKGGHLIGWEALMPKEHKPLPLAYEVLEFCGNPTCEKVFKAERMVEHE